MKSRQFCSVCKQWLDMEVVPTNDGDEDDGVIWFRCPQCQGFLPKLSGADLTEGEVDESAPEQTTSTTGVDSGVPGTEPAVEKSAVDDSMPWDSPADMMAAQEASRKQGGQAPSPFLPEDDTAGASGVDVESDAGPDEKVAGSGRKSDEKKEPAEPPEPIHEYAAMLAGLDVGESTPYRPWGTYETGQCIHHLAWEDCGVVVAKEDLPGGRKIIKCYFEDAGVVRLIEQAPR
jgi:hypothetical protein